MLLRLGAGISLSYLGVKGLPENLVDPVSVARNLIAVAGGILLLAGLWTPVAGALIAMVELWIASSPHLTQQVSQPGSQWVHLLLAVMSGAVAMLGPGAWSVDAHLFGRKRFDIGDWTRGR